MQACYGHTEGTAGITGLLLAASALQEGASVPIVNLRDINPYVGAAIGDMKHMSAHGPRQLAPGVQPSASGPKFVGPTLCHTAAVRIKSSNCKALLVAACKAAHIP